VVNAPAAGVVADVGQYTLMGRSVFIDHGNGVYSAFFHLDTALVRRGDEVVAGKQVGRVGSTGLATGPHLHYGVYINGRDVDPALWREAVSWMESNKSVAQRTDTSGSSKGKNHE
jgi:lysostaphin